MGKLKQWLIKFFNGVEHQEVVIEAEHVGEAIATHAANQIGTAITDMGQKAIDEAVNAATGEITSITEHVESEESHQ